VLAYTNRPYTLTTASGQVTSLSKGPPPAAPGFEAPLVCAMQKPAAKEPDPAAVAALAALRPPDEGGGAAAARSSAAAGGGAASTGSERGTKRKRDGPRDDDDDESGAHDFAQAEDYLLARQLGQAEERAEADEQEEEEEEEDDDEGEQEDEGTIIPMPGQDLVSVGAMVVGTGEGGFQDGAAAAVMFMYVRTMLHLPDGRVLVTDGDNHRVRVLSADLQQVSTVAGDGAEGHRDGAAAQAQFSYPNSLALLPDGRVLLSDFGNHRIRVLSADLQQVSTLTNVDELDNPAGLCLLPDGRLLVGNGNRIRVLEGFPAALLGTKPSHKKPKKTKQQLLQEKKTRALAGGASSSSSSGASSCGPVPKRSRSGASSAAAAMSSSDDSEGEEQPGGSAAEAEPLV